MIVNKNNIKTVLDAPGKKTLWVVPGAFCPIYKLTYIGMHDGKAMFVNGAAKTEMIDLFKPGSNVALKEGRICTTHETALAVLRELCLEEIDYYNSRQGKDNPIVYEKKV